MQIIFAFKLRVSTYQVVHGESIGQFKDPWALLVNFINSYLHIIALLRVIDIP